MKNLYRITDKLLFELGKNEKYIAEYSDFFYSNKYMKDINFFV